MPNCIKCRTYNNEGNVHCKKCNAILPIEGEKHCPNCASLNGPFTKVCKECGGNMKGNVVRLQLTRDEKERPMTNNSSYTKLSTYKKKRFFGKMFSKGKSIFNKAFFGRIMMVVLLLLFIVGVIASFK